MFAFQFCTSVQRFPIGARQTIIIVVSTNLSLNQSRESNYGSKEETERAIISEVTQIGKNEFAL